MAVDLTKAKTYRFGKKDLITLVNSFEMAMGTHNVLWDLINILIHYPFL